MTDSPIEVAALTPEAKRALLARLLMKEAEGSATAYPLSQGQRSLWFMHKLAPAGAAYTVSYAGRIRGELDLPALERAARVLVDRHPMLRTTYTERDGQPVQLVHPQWPVRISEHPIGSDAEVDDWIRRETDLPFDLYTAPPLRLTLLTRAPDDHILLLAVHHIAVDFWSIDVILDELGRLYAAEHGGEVPPAPTGRYVDYAAEQQAMLDGAAGDELWAYWRDQLSGELPILQLPTDRPRPAVQTYRGALHRFSIDAATSAALTDAGRAAGATPYMTALAAYTALLHRYTGQDDVIVGSPFACRDRAALTGVVGYLANPVPLRMRLGDDPTFTTLLGRVKDSVLGAIAHQDFPFPLLVERLRPPRDAGRTPVFQVSFAWEQTRQFSDDAATGAGELALQTVHIGQGGAPFDLTMQMGEHAGRLEVALQYNTDLFDTTTIERMAAHFTTLLAGIAADPQARVSQLPLLTEAEEAQLRQWNDTAVSYPALAQAPASAPASAPAPAPAGLADLVAATAARLPDTIAVSAADGELSYTDLDQRANGLAHRLQQLGVGPDTVVPVLLERSTDLVVALLAVLKAGGAFLPLDPDQPDQRLAAMFADVPDAPAVLTHRDLLGRVPADVTGARLCLDTPAVAALRDATAPEAPEARVTGENLATRLAYVIYTSGSTGTPKGAMNTHAGIINRLLWMQDTFELTGADVVLHKTPMSFDPSVWEIFWPLLAGARVVIAVPEGHKDAGYLVRTIIDSGVTTMHFVPSMLRRFLAEPGAVDCVGLRQVFCSGEVLGVDVRDEFLTNSGAELYNLYGPTEAAIDVTAYHCRRGVPDPVIPIGEPIANIAIHLLDPHGRPVPVGVPGELFIGGVGVALGYLNRPELTDAAFVADPFAEPGTGRRMYRTGDRARYRPDGNIEYLGRSDNQVKVRGFRIEPGEIEAALAKHPAIVDAAVVAAPDPHGNTMLVAHLVGSGAPPAPAALRHFLLELLPAAMVPAVFRFTDALPLSSSGKVDRRALAAADAAQAPQTTEFVAPRNPTEQLLADIWCAVLDMDRVGVDDDFFALGGASTQALEVSLRASDAGLELRPESMFVYGTIAELVAEFGPPEGTELTAPEPDRVASAPVGVQDAAVQAVAARPVTAVSGPRRNTVIESLGVYLPEKIVSTETVLADCRNEIRIPLERVTGIKNRRMAGETEFSADLARNAARDALSRSSYRPEDIDLVIACNISRCDGPGHMFTFEPSTASRLREECGLTHAVSFDINNACAGMFTGINVADAFLQTGLIRSALVVSGEYISHLTETAQQEIDGPMDPRLACLTLGDAGAAVVLERGPNDRVGFHDLDMATLSRYAKLCIAKATDGPHGGAIMYTDSVTQTAVAVKHSVPYVADVMGRHGWRPETCDHVLMHQTSESSINDAVGAVNRVFGPGAVNRSNTIYNLAERGNTATTSHFVALVDNIRSNRMNSGDNVVFSITGSGQTVGTALYTFDDLPDRIRRADAGHPVPALRTAADRADLPPTPRVRIEALGLAPDSGAAHPSSIDAAVQAATACLDRSDVDPTDIGLLIHAGIYRDDFLSEPAVAALVAGELDINGDVSSPDGAKTLAFDVLNGAVGFLNACHVAAGMIGAGRTGHAMVLASEVENNTPESGYPRHGISQTGSALLLGTGDGREGFGRFVFGHHPEYRAALHTYTQQRNGRTWLRIDRDPNLAAVYLGCIPSTVKELLALEGLAPSDIAVVFPPYLPTATVTDLAARLDIPRSRFVELTGETDPFTSSVPHALERARTGGRVHAGDIGLIIAVGSGVEVAVTTYRF